MLEFTEIMQIHEKIDVEKEILASMPKNNEKNIDKYLEKIYFLKKEYVQLQDKIYTVLAKRYDKAQKLPMNENVKELDIKIKTMEDLLPYLDDDKTSYEKMELDKIIYRIKKFYKDNLENVNIQIEKTIEQFAKVGINLELEDFEYSLFVKQYMKVFFEEKRKGDINSNRIKEKFEEIYWKCPELIIHIELNIRNLYLKKQAEIDKYFQKEKLILLKQMEKNTEEIKEMYLLLKEQKNNALSEDEKYILNAFLNGRLDIKNFTEEKIKSFCDQILEPTMFENGINESEIEKDMLSLLNCLYEYKNYIKFKYIFDDIKEKFSKKDEYKKIYEESIKKILLDEKRLKKVNKQSTVKLFFRKNKEQKQTAEQNQIIKEIKEDYKELDKNKFLNKIYTNLNENSTIYNVFSLANSYYNYLAKIIIENNKTITQEKIDEQIQDLNDFVNTPYNNIINNITILDEKDIAMIIKDKYKLLNFNIKIDNFTPKNLEILINLLENVITSFKMKKIGLEVKYVEELLQIKNTLKIM